MRILVTTPGGRGHVYPMVPLAVALASRGHDVRWAVPEQAAGEVTQHSLETIPVPGREPISPQEVLRRHPEIAELPPERRPEEIFGKLFGAMATPAMLESIERAAETWPPELVVADAADFAGHIVAASLGVPSVTKGFGALLPEARVARAGQEVAALWKARGLVPRPYGGAYDTMYIDIYPRELQIERGPHVPNRQPMKPVSTDALPADASELPLPTARQEAPLVYVTMGTVFNEAEPLRRAVEGIRELPVRVLVTVGPNGDPLALGDQPDHVRVERFVPQSALLPLCDLVVSHAGSGTTLGALALGLPQVCLPQGADQFLNADAVMASGAGLSVAPDAATPATIGDAVNTVLESASFLSAAQRVASSIDGMPTPSEVASILEALP